MPSAAIYSLRPQGDRQSDDVVHTVAQEVHGYTGATSPTLISATNPLNQLPFSFFAISNYDGSSTNRASGCVRSAVYTALIVI
jgi:hypothetical protein